MSLELRRIPLVHLAGQQSGLGAERNVSRVRRIWGGKVLAE